MIGTFYICYHCSLVYTKFQTKCPVCGSESFDEYSLKAIPIAKED